MALATEEKSDTRQPFDLSDENVSRIKELGVMLGREDFLGSTTVARGSADTMIIPKTFAWAKT